MKTTTIIHIGYSLINSCFWFFLLLFLVNSCEQTSTNLSVQPQSHVINGYSENRAVDLTQRIKGLPKGSSLPMQDVMHALDLWDQRHRLNFSRRTNVLFLELDSKKSIRFFVEGELIAIPRIESGSLWDVIIKDLNIEKIVFLGLSTDLLK